VSKQRSPAAHIDTFDRSVFAPETYPNAADRPLISRRGGAVLHDQN
jgi:hypothetical protein